MATISLKKKTGGTAVGNAIRSVVGAIKGIGGASQTGSAMKFPVGQGLTDKQTANANKALGISKTTTGGLTYNTSQAQTIQNAKFSKPQAITNADINKAVKSGGITQPVKYSQYVGGNSNKNTGGFTALSTSGSLNPDMTGGESGITTLRSGLSSTSGLGGTNSIVSPNSSIPSSNIINTQKAGLANNEFNYPDPSKVDYSFTPITIDQERLNLESEQKKTEDNYLKNLLKDFQEKESASEIDARLQRELGIKEKKQRVSSLNEQLNTIVNRGQANQLSLIGQGRGIPEAIIGGQQAQIGRETAIAALPVQAQLSAAQGDLEMAKDSLDRLFKIYSDEADNNFAFKKEVNSFLYQSATAKQKKKLEDIDKKEERRYQEQKEVRKEQQDYAKMAFENNQASLGSKIAKLDYKSPTFKTDLSNLINKLQDPVKNAQLRKLNAEIAELNNAGQVVGGVNENLTAYASQYADTGKLPSPAELKQSKLSIGQVTTMAKQIPKPKGVVVSSLTGTKSNSISAEAEKDFQKLYNVTEMTKRLKELDKKRVGGLVSGTVGKIFGSEDQGEYLTLRKAIVDEMSRMQSGAALTPDEIAVYNDYLPGRFSESFGLGRDSLKKIVSFENAMNQKLQNRLANNALSIYGYSKVKVGKDLRTVGEILDIDGVNYRVLPDGTLTDIL